jgi:hypothetical protein
MLLVPPPPSPSACMRHTPSSTAARPATAGQPAASFPAAPQRAL